MRLLKYLLPFLLIPQFAFAAVAVPMSATTTTGTIFAFPTKVNGIDPAIMSKFFFGSSTATSTFLGPIFNLAPMAHFGTTTCGTGGLNLSTGVLQGDEYCGNDDTDTGGVQRIISNSGKGARSWGGLTLNNDLADATLTHYAGLYYNSSRYTSTFFGGIFGIPNEVYLQNTDGPVSIVASTGTSQGYIGFVVGSVASTSEMMRISNNGNIGIASTTPWGRLSINLNTYATTAGPAFIIASSTATATSTLFQVNNVGSTTIGLLGTCSGSNALNTTAVGLITCGAVSSSLAAPFIFNLLNTWSTSTAATTTSIWTQGVFFSSSTKQASQLPYATSTSHTIGGGFDAFGIDKAVTVLNAGSISIGSSTTFAPFAIFLSPTTTPLANASQLAFSIASSSGYFSTSTLFQISTTGSTTVSSNLNAGNTYLNNASTTSLFVSGSTTILGVLNVSGLSSSSIPYASTTALSASSAIYAGAGTVSNPSVQVTGGEGLYQIGANSLGISNGVSGLTWNGTAFFPNTNALRNLGVVSTNLWQNIYANYASTTALTVSGGLPGSFSVGSTTPWGIVSLNSNGVTSGAPAFVIGSSTKTDFIVTNSGSIGISTSSPYGLLSMQVSTTSFNNWNGTLFVIASSTAGGATSTLFSIMTTANTHGAYTLGSTTPLAYLSINLLTTDSFNNNYPVAFQIASSSPLFATSSLFLIDNTGHQYASTTQPTLSSCGTGPVFTGNIGNDNWGEVTVGATGAGCTITFANAWKSKPVCVVSNQSMSVVNAMTYTISTTAIVISMTGAGGDLIDYECHGNASL